jgi:putative transposase
VLLGALGITKTRSRPHVSNDNPYSEAQFKTLKYCSEFLNHFGSYEDALGFCHAFFRIPWERAPEPRMVGRATG